MCISAFGSQSTMLDQHYATNGSLTQHMRKVHKKTPNHHKVNIPMIKIMCYFMMSSHWSLHQLMKDFLDSWASIQPHSWMGPQVWAANGFQPVQASGIHRMDPWNNVTVIEQVGSKGQGIAECKDIKIQSGYKAISCQYVNEAKENFKLIRMMIVSAETESLFQLRIASSGCRNEFFKLWSVTRSQ